MSIQMCTSYQNQQHHCHTDSSGAISWWNGSNDCRNRGLGSLSLQRCKSRRSSSSRDVSSLTQVVTGHGSFWKYLFLTMQEETTGCRHCEDYLKHVVEHTVVVYPV
ncbi:uncharacterized protein LOC126910604 [Spodoptera frugiperda]|uniref:Uncharacterized protein LOC126910604 n=1 Tax=Spodoptera frugiperda TaxID=7108 RepID=A0A9R0ECW4_SPOFR|nr:uncharacterized protein LOC126910604 [Spodoptera frugiperda]